MRRTLGRKSVVGGLLTVALVAGCSVGSELIDGDRPDAVAKPTLARCPKAASELPAYDDEGQPAGAGRIPDGFGPTRAAHCTWDSMYLDDAATRRQVTMVESHAASVTDALIRSLELVDQEFAPLSHSACPAIGDQPEYLILIDSVNRGVIVRLPQTPCGEPRREVREAIAGLHLHEYARYRFNAPTGV